MKGNSEGALELIQVQVGGWLWPRHTEPPGRGGHGLNPGALALQYEIRGRGLPDGGCFGSTVPLATRRGWIRGAVARPPLRGRLSGAAAVAAAPAYIKT